MCLSNTQDSVCPYFQTHWKFTKNLSSCYFKIWSTWSYMFDISSVFPPDCANVGIPHCIQRRPPEKWRKGQFSLLLSQGCMRAKPGHSILIAIPKLKIATDTVTNELTIYKTTNISSWRMATKNSGLVTIIATSFLYVEDQ